MNVYIYRYVYMYIYIYIYVYVCVQFPRKAEGFAGCGRTE